MVEKSGRFIMTPQPTGRLVRHSDGVYIVLDRVFLSPIDDVWGSLTRPYRLHRWLGECTGEPRTGAVRIRKAGIPDAQWDDVAVLQCDSPHRFRGEIGPSGASRRVYFHLSHASSYTTVTFGERVKPLATEAGVGVLAEYVLDRLVAGRTKHAMPTWDAYTPALLPYYEKLLREPPIPRAPAPAASALVE
jgi:uncharacterized protein YndB with AHSA1/START domain